MRYPGTRQFQISIIKIRPAPEQDDIRNFTDILDFLSS